MRDRAISFDWLEKFSDATSTQDAVSRMRTATLQAMRPVMSDPDVVKPSPEGAASIGKAIDDELARRASWDGYVDYEGLPS